MCVCVCVCACVCKSRGLGSKPLGGSKVDLAFLPSKVDEMSTRNSWGLSGKK